VDATDWPDISLENLVRLSNEWMGRLVPIITPDFGLVRSPTQEAMYKHDREVVSPAGLTNWLIAFLVRKKFFPWNLPGVLFFTINGVPNVSAFYMVEFKLFPSVEASHNLETPECNVRYHKNVAVLVHFAFMGSNTKSCADLVTTEQSPAKTH
jgi:hypothetical protein